MHENTTNKRQHVRQLLIEAIERRKLYEQSLGEFMRKYFRGLLPSSLGNIVANVDFKDIKKRLFREFRRRFGFGDRSNMTLENAKKFLVMKNMHPDFVEMVYNDFKKKMKITRDDEREYEPGETDKLLDQFFSVVAGHVLMYGGLRKVSRGNYRPISFTKRKAKNTTRTNKKLSRKVAVDLMKLSQIVSNDPKIALDLIDFMKQKGYMK